MKKLIVLLAIMYLAVAGCKSEPEVQRLTVKSLDTSSKVLVLLTSTDWDSDIRRALGRQGFIVKKYTIDETKGVDIKETYKAAGARYGLGIYPGKIIDVCASNKDAMEFDNFRLELVDLETDEIVVVVEEGGWVTECFLASSWIDRRPLFYKLATALASQWY
jgi:hypothetical protein